MEGGEQTPGAKVVGFGAFEADLSSGELRKHGTRLRLQEQPFKVLAALLERRGEVVTREELVKLLWPDGTFVDYDRGLNAAISRLRQVLSDSAENPRFVETVARRGYRFIGPLEIPESPAAVTQPLRARAPTLRWAWLVGATTVMALLSIWWWRSAKGTEVPLEPVPLTSYPGAELHPSFSPDGTQVAFSWNGEKQDNFDIYVKTVGSDPPRRLTTDPSADDFPTWSPDGRYIAFQRGRPQGVFQDIYVVAPTGGAERSLLRAIRREHWWVNPHAWSADGKYLAFASDRTGDEPAGILLIAAEGGPARRLTTVADPGTHEAPSFSPDGKFLAFASCEGDFGVCKLSILPLANGRDPGGPLRQVARCDWGMFQIAWTGDARSLVFADFAGVWWGAPIWKVPLNGRAQRELVARSAVGHAISAAARRMAYSQSLLVDSEIWQLEDTGAVRSPLSSTFNDTDPQFSPDGTKVVFASDRSGRPEIWTANADGSGLMRLTSSKEASGSPRWSPDGRTIVYDTFNANGLWDIDLIPAAGGQPVPIVRHPANDFAPGFSRDGMWIYFASDRRKQTDIYRVRVTGGDPVRITENRGAIAFESFDGKSVYYLKENVARDVPLFVRPLDGGAERKLINSVSSRSFAVTKDGIYYTSSAEVPDRLHVLLFDPANRKSREVRRNVGPFYGLHSLTVSPDSKTILLGASAQMAADLYLIENFR